MQGPAAFSDYRPGKCAYEECIENVAPRNWVIKKKSFVGMDEAYSIYPVAAAPGSHSNLRLLAAD
jgi:hypothetical protein